ncbi:RNA-binding motif protein, X-linked 2-like, partial [Mizuhopecten yessoensis]|uniref:RNA-binding motif protein, X-linked 2-like n=1 Tax=Mizuhopecten yessoensis TaxID=6573 RepID=UPI000B45A833
MNPLTNVRNTQELNKKELELGLIGKKSWHDKYKDSAWVFLGGLPYELTEGDVICVFSQYGEVVNVNLVRDKATGKFKGFGFLCYQDQRSTVLAVDNLNGFSVSYILPPKPVQIVLPDLKLLTKDALEKLHVPLSHINTATISLISKSPYYTAT